MGMTILEAFLQQGSVSTDTRQIKEGDLFFALKGPNFNGNAFAARALEAGASYAVIDEQAYAVPGDARYLLVPDSLKALQQLARDYRRRFDIPILGITGSNGKTTTKELIQAVLATEKRVFATPGNLNNHIGVPLSLLSMPADTQLAVIEMGANQPGDIAELAHIALPTHGIITNIGQAHLERFHSIEGVRKTKGELFDFLRTHGGTAFVNTLDTQVMRAAKGLKQMVTYGRQDSHAWVEVLHSSLQGMQLHLHHRQWPEPLHLESALSGSYNALNILAAACIGVYFGLKPTSIQQGIASYRPTNNRSQLLRRGDYTIWLDAYNANPTSMRAAISHLMQVAGGKKVALILGDMYELGAQSEQAHRELGEFVHSLHPYRLIGIGAHMKQTVAVAGGVASWFPDVETAKDALPGLLKGAEVLLLKGSRGVALEGLLEVL